MTDFQIHTIGGDVYCQNGNTILLIGDFDKIESFIEDFTQYFEFHIAEILDTPGIYFWSIEMDNYYYKLAFKPHVDPILTYKYDTQIELAICNFIKTNQIDSNMLGVFYTSIHSATKYFLHSNL